MLLSDVRCISDILKEKLSIAENFLYMLKKDYTELDARTLDLLLILQAEHGGGNNSTFTVRVTSSTGTDTYFLGHCRSIGSLKGPFTEVQIFRLLICSIICRRTSRTGQMLMRLTPTLLGMLNKRGL